MINNPLKYVDQCKTNVLIVFTVQNFIGNNSESLKINIIMINNSLNDDD